MKRRKKLFVVAGLLSVLGVALATVYLAYPRLLLRALIAVQRSRAGFDCQRMEIQSWRLPWIEAQPSGETQPETILLVHGFGDSKDSFLEFAAGLPDTYRIVALDLPGFGDTDLRMEENYQASFYVRLILEFLDRIEVDSVHLVGYSMGGMLAAKVAAESPSRVRTLTLLAPGGLSGDRPSRMDLMIAEGKGNPLTYHDRASFDQLMQLNFNRQLDLPEFICRALVEQGRERERLHNLIFDELFDPANQATFEREIAALQMPVLLVWGTEDQILDVSAADQWMQANPGIRLVIIPHVGHDLIRMRIDKIHQEIRAHLKTVTSRRK